MWTVLTPKELEVMTLRRDGLTQTAVAKKLKITQAAVSKFEQNAKAKITDAYETVKVARLLDMQPAQEPDILKQLRGGRE